MHGCDYSRSVEAKQLDEGIGDTFVSVDATSCLCTSDSVNASQMWVNPEGMPGADADFAAYQYQSMIYIVPG